VTNEGGDEHLPATFEVFVSACIRHAADAGPDPLLTPPFFMPFFMGRRTYLPLTSFM
jgi:hypothetical protein